MSFNNTTSKKAAENPAVRQLLVGERVKDGGPEEKSSSNLVPLPRNWVAYTTKSALTLVTLLKDTSINFVARL